MPLAEDATVGERIAFHRKRRGLTQAVLSGLLGRSEEWLSQIERGSRSVERLTTIVDVAKVLRLEPSLLLPAPFFSKPRQIENNGTIGTAPEWVPAIRAAMMKRTGSEDAGGPPRTRSLSRELQRGFGYSQTERWSDLGDDLAVEALREAKAHATEQLLFTRRVGEMLAGMLRRDRRNRRELRSLAVFAGVT